MGQWGRRGVRNWDSGCQGNEGETPPTHDPSFGCESETTHGRTSRQSRNQLYGSLLQLHYPVPPLLFPPPHIANRKSKPVRPRWQNPLRHSSPPAPPRAAATGTMSNTDFLGVRPPPSLLPPPLTPGRKRSRSSKKPSKKTQPATMNKPTNNTTPRSNASCSRSNGKRTKNPKT